MGENLQFYRKGILHFDVNLLRARSILSPVIVIFVIVTTKRLGKFSLRLYIFRDLQMLYVFESLLHTIAMK